MLLKRQSLTLAEIDFESISGDAFLVETVVVGVAIVDEI